MRKVLHIVESTATGTLSMLAVIANEQYQQGHSIVVAYSARDETPPNLHEMFTEGIDLVPLSMSGFSGLTGVFKIRSLLRTRKPDTVICHSSTAGFLGRLSGLGLPGRWFYIPHCISTMRRDISPLVRLAFTCAERLAALKDADYIAVSKSEREEIRKRVPYRRCHLVENAVDTEFWENDICWHERECSVVTVGQIREQKGPREFANVARNLRSHGSKLKFIWVGDGYDDGLKNELIDAGVEITGWKTRGQVREYLTHSRYFLSTAKWEGLPVSAIEAMVAGCLLVLSNCPGNVDVVSNRQTGLLCTDVEDITDCLAELVSNAWFSEEIADRGKRHALRLYSLENYRSRLCEVIDAEKRILNTLHHNSIY